MGAGFLYDLIPRKTNLTSCANPILPPQVFRKKGALFSFCPEEER